MPAQDTSIIKEKIVSFIRQKGPSLPIQISKAVGTSTLFASAFLSELISEKRINMSQMRVGSSPIYFVPEQEDKLENFSQYLKSKEKEAFALLKQKKFIKDSEPVPAIRVALREIKDFAIPFKKGDDIYWRYFTAPESEFEEEKQIKKMEKVLQPLIKPDDQEIETPKEIREKRETKKLSKKKQVKKKNGKDKDDKFFNNVKEFLLKKSMGLLDIEGVNKTELSLKVNYNGKEHLLIAYNKKKISEEDILKAHKKSLELGLPYIILSLGETTKKLANLIEAIKNLEKIDIIE